MGNQRNDGSGREWPISGVHVDRELANLLRQDSRAHKERISLVASESYASREALALQASSLACRLWSEDDGPVRQMAEARACALFGAEHANVLPYSGTHANLAAYLAVAPPGSNILALAPTHGGHLSHGESPHLSSRLWNFDFYHTDATTGWVDLDELRELARRHRPAAIICGGTSYPRVIDFSAFADVSQETGARLVADIAHPAGLVVSGQHPSPVGLADIITSSTHKTLCGPRGGGLLLCRAEWAGAVDQALSPGLQAAPVANVVISRACVFQEAQTERFHRRMETTRALASRLATNLLDGGLSLFTGGTDTHMVVVDMATSGLDAHAVHSYLRAAGVDANVCAVPGRPDGGLRMGTTTLAQRGFTADAIDRLVSVLGVLFKTRTPNATSLERAAAVVMELSGAFPPPALDPWS